ncbi:diaminopimelate epimerase [Motilibacter rhizosphaerae]|uniref:Diaminopimelate epimerase n=1 Tax=Motilibacter rhizosphaerae TaxID=598652 RepID=A0A4Q7NNT5_9ACTN|nr:diaminopimelate epimerase [Motilibacter rhizosphaerae]RZS86914.1 diaminopimelate epimerase [Motilibacter rhizosphaerae]
MSGLLQLTKGHGTENDFLLVADPDGLLDIGPDLVAALCDRRAGIGADGLIRAVRSGALPEGAAYDEATWFMDYRNADGSIAEMCGNGVRVFARFLAAQGLVEPDLPLSVATRGGLKAVRFEDDGAITVGMGVPGPGPERVTVTTGAGQWTASGVHLPNPHAVALVDDPDAVGTLVDVPLVEPATAYPEGVNVEFVQVVAPGLLRMRVHERGVGETRSCGTGICAAAVVAARSHPGTSTWQVEVPGGTCSVALLPDGTLELTGPAVLVATLEVDPSALTRWRIPA